MKKAILILIFAIALFGQPTGVQVDLSVVSVDSSSGEVCFKADAWPDGAIFDVTDDHISVPDHADLNFDTTGDFTIEAWFKADAVGRQNPIVCKLVGSNPNFTGYQMWIAPDNKLKAFICDGSYTLVASSSTISANTWYYAAFTVDRDGNEKVYLNGSLDCTPVDVSGVGNINTDTTLWIGRATHSPSLAFDGTIAEVRISDVTRSDAEIADAYALGGTFENDANTIALWHLNEGSGTATGDSSGNGHDGTLTNGAAWGDGVIVNPIPGATWTIGLLPTPPQFTYDYDWENDATYDLTDAGDSVCHTYTPGETLWAKVKAATDGYEAEDSAEVIVPEGGGYNIRVHFAVPEFDSTFFRVTDVAMDADGMFWLEGDWPLAIMDTCGNRILIEDILEGACLKDHHLLKQYSSLKSIDTVLVVAKDTFWTEVDSVIEYDSTLVRSLYNDYPDWIAYDSVYRIEEIGKNGWAIVKLNRTKENDSLYPGWEYAFAKDGELIAENPWGGCSSPYCQFKNGLITGLNSDNKEVFVLNSNGSIIFSGPFCDYQMPWRMGAERLDEPGFELLEDSSLVYFTGHFDSLQVVKTDFTNEYSFLLPPDITVDSAKINFFIENNRMLIRLSRNAVSDTGRRWFTSYVYYFDISDSLQLLWHDTMDVHIDYAGVLPDGNPYIVAWEKDTAFELLGWKIRVLDGTNGNVLRMFPDDFQTSSLSFAGRERQSVSNYIYFKHGDSPLPEKGVIVIEGRW